MEKIAKKCVIIPNSLNELKNIQKNAPFMVTAFTMDGCHHCEAFKPKLEEQCISLNKLTPFSVIPTVNCPINKEFCYDEFSKLAQKFPKIGVPFTIGTPQNKPSVFEIQGNNQDELGHVYGVLHSLVNETTKKMVENHGKTGKI